MSRTCASLVCLYGSCYKARRCCQRWNLARNAARWSDMMTDQNQYYITALKPAKYSPRGIITSSTHQTLSLNQNNYLLHLMMLCAKGSLEPLKHKCEDNVEGSSKHQIRGKKVDYGHLHDPFSDNEVMNTKELTNLLKGDDDQPTFKQAKCSLKWPEWDKAIQAELAQL